MKKNAKHRQAERHVRPAGYPWIKAPFGFESPSPNVEQGELQ